jgi:hypothetical protein
MQKDNVISFTEFKSNKESEKEYKNPLPGSEEILDLVDQYFDVGVFIGIIDDKIQVTATTTDVEDVLYILHSAIENIEDELGYRKDLDEDYDEDLEDN